MRLRGEGLRMTQRVTSVGFLQALVIMLVVVGLSAAAYAGAASLLRLEELGLVWRLVRRRRAAVARERSR